MANKSNPTTLVPYVTNRLRSAGTDVEVTVKIAGKRFVLPIKGKALRTKEGVGYLHIPSLNEVVTLADGNATPLAEDQVAGAIETLKAQTMKPRGKKGTAASKADAPEMTPEIQAALNAIPAGFKLVPRKDGSYTIVKGRTRKAKETAAA